MCLKNARKGLFFQRLFEKGSFYPLSHVTPLKRQKKVVRMQIGNYVRSVLMPQDLAAGPVLFEYVGPCDVDWRNKKIAACNFIGGINGQAYDVRIFASRLHPDGEKLMLLEQGKKYWLKAQGEKDFLVKAA